MRLTLEHEVLYRKLCSAETQELLAEIDALRIHLQVACVAAGFTDTVDLGQLEQVIDSQDPITGKVPQQQRITRLVEPKRPAATCGCFLDEAKNCKHSDQT